MDLRDFLICIAIRLFPTLVFPSKKVILLSGIRFSTIHSAGGNLVSRSSTSSQEVLSTFGLSRIIFHPATEGPIENPSFPLQPLLYSFDRVGPSLLAKVSDARESQV